VVSLPCNSRARISGRRAAEGRRRGETFKRRFQLLLSLSTAVRGKDRFQESANACAQSGADAQRRCEKRHKCQDRKTWNVRAFIEKNCGPLRAPSLNITTTPTLPFFFFTPFNKLEDSLYTQVSGFCEHTLHLQLLQSSLIPRNNNTSPQSCLQLLESIWVPPTVA
jgi:hypothetical protein